MSLFKTLKTAAGFGLSATIAAFTIGANPAHSQPAPGQRGFWCDTTSGIPTTMYQNSSGGREPWIRWVSDYFAESGYDPITRCQMVSGRLEGYRVAKSLKLITVGIMNRQPVICTASQVNGRCDGLIYTLKQGQNAAATLHTFLAWREGQAATPSLYESGETLYIDVQPHLDPADLAETSLNVEDPVDTTTEAPAAIESAPESEGTESGELREL